MKRKFLMKALPIVAAGIMAATSAFGGVVILPATAIVAEAAATPSSLPSGPNDPAPYNPVEGTIRINQEGYVLDGMDLQGVRVIVNAANATVSNCTNASNIYLCDAAKNCTISGNTFVNPDTAIQLDAGATGCTLSGNVITGAKSYGIRCLAPSTTISKNQVSGTTGVVGISLVQTANCNVTGNTITNSAQQAIYVEYDNGSIVNANQIEDDGVFKQDAISVILQDCTGTVFQNNSISKSKFSSLVAAKCKDCDIYNNTITDSAYYSIQVSYQSANVQIRNNTLSGAKNSMINISRGVTNAVVSGNLMSDSSLEGIAVSTGGAGKCSATITGNRMTKMGGQAGIFVNAGTVTIENNEIIQSKNAGILITNAASVTAKANQLSNNGMAGMIAYAKSSLVANDNLIYVDTIRITMEDTSAMGIVVNEGSSLEANDNRIVNYCYAGIYAPAGTTVTGKGNQIMKTGKDAFTSNPYNTDAVSNASTTTLKYNNLLNPTITTSSASGGCYYADGFEGGAVVGNQKYTGEAVGGKFNVTFPAQASTDGIVAYIQDKTNGNAICVNVPSPTFSLKPVANPSGPLVDPGAKPYKEMDETKVRAFVTRMYNIVLNREPDEVGIKYWTDGLKSGKMDGSFVLQNFLLSNEFLAKGYSNQQLVNICYQSCFGREGDEGGMKYWLGKFDAGMSSAVVVKGFSESTEFANLCSDYGIDVGKITLTEARDKNEGVTRFVVRNYEKALGRTYDIQGLNFWCEKILSSSNAKEAAAEAASSGFFNSNEFLAKNLNNNDFIEVSYQTFFGRSGEEGGVNFWLGQLAGGMSRDDMLKQFAASNEFAAIMASYGL